MREKCERVREILVRMSIAYQAIFEKYVQMHTISKAIELKL